MSALEKALRRAQAQQKQAPRPRVEAEVDEQDLLFAPKVVVSKLWPEDRPPK